MDFVIVIFVFIVSYLVGAFSFARFVTRILAPDVDLENVELPSTDGSGEGYRLEGVGATTASIKLGGGVGCLIAWLDIFKVALPTLVFRLVYPEQPYFLIAAAAGMVGHNWPIYYRFKGGGGMSSIYGGLLVVDWLGAIVCSTAGMIFGFFVVRDILVAYLAGAWFVIPWLWLRTHDPAYVIYAVAINILFILAMLPSIRHQMKSRREGKTDITAGLESFPMGQGMLKMMNFFKRDKPKSES